MPLPKPLYATSTSPTRGRHLLSTQFIPRNTLIFLERPLLSLQSLSNIHQTTLICHNCHCFVGGPELALRLLSEKSKRQDIISSISGERRQIDSSSADDIVYHCRNNCGFVFCSEECRDDSFFNHGHDLVCTGCISEEQERDRHHPLLEFKIHAIHTNEILLMVAHVITTIIARRRTMKSTLEEVVKPYIEFVSIPWWKHILQSSGDETLSETCRQLCDESADLFHEALRYHATLEECDADTRMAIEECGEYVTGEFFGRLIGSFEMNAIGIRATHPICEDLVWADGEEVNCMSEDIGKCIELANIGENCEEDEESDDENEEHLLSETQSAKAFIEESPPNYSPEEIQSLLNTLPTTTLSQIFPPLDGTGMYSIACQMNHSCDPNVQVRYLSGWGKFRPLILQCIALRDIPPGDELCFSYIDQNGTLEERKEMLKNYCFECTCDKCLREGSGEVKDETEEDLEELFGSDEEDNTSSSLLNEEESHKETSDSEFVSLPMTIFAPSASLTLQLGNALLSEKHDNNQTSSSLRNYIHDCMKSVQDRNFHSCFKTGQNGCDVFFSDILQGEKNVDKSFCKIGHNICAMTAALGYTQRGYFMDALKVLDVGCILGLLSEGKAIRDLFEYVQFHAKSFCPRYMPLQDYVILDYRRECIEEKLQFLKEELLIYPIQEVDVSSCFDLGRYASNSQPVVIRSYARNWPAVRKWRNLNELSHQQGHRIIPIEIGNIDMQSTSTQINSQMKESLLTLQQFIASYLIPSCQNDQDLLLNSKISHQTKVAYLAQHSLFDQIPELFQDVFTSPPVIGKNPIHVNAWIGTSQTRTPLHFDSYDNLFVQIAGLKYVRIYGQEETHKLYVVSDGTKYYGRQGNMSEVDCEREDWDRHPLAAEAKFLEVLMFPGDALFIPARAWHYVRGLSTSISVNYWW